MSGKTQHNQVSICTINTMARVWIKTWLGALRSNKVQNFMFTFTWNESIGKDNRNSFPQNICIASLKNVLLECNSQSEHEFSARCDDI